MLNKASNFTEKKIGTFMLRRISYVVLNVDCIIVRLRKSRHANLCSKNQFFRENIVVIAFSELRPGSNERYDNSTFMYFSMKWLIYKSIYEIQG